jgi:hypothetical protein
MAVHYSHRLRHIHGLLIKATCSFRQWDRNDHGLGLRTEDPQKYVLNHYLLIIYSKYCTVYGAGDSKSYIFKVITIFRREAI